MAYNMYVCPECRKMFRISGSGKKAKCTKCQDSILVDTEVTDEEWKTFSPIKKNDIISHLLDEPEVIEYVEENASNSTVQSQPEASAKNPNNTSGTSFFDSPASTPAPEPTSNSFFDDSNVNMESSSTSSNSSFFNNTSTNAGSSSTTNKKSYILQDSSTYGTQKSYTQSSKTPNSKLSIFAFILSILGCTFIIGLVLALIDLKNKDDGNNHSLSYTSLVICGLWFVLGIGIKAFGGGSSSKKSEVAETTSSVESSVEGSKPDTISIENDNTESSESSDGVIMPDLIGMSIEDASEALHENGLTAKASYVSSDLPKDLIVAQDISAGDNIDKGSTVTLEVSNGKYSDEESDSDASTEASTPKEPEMAKDDYIASCEELNFKAIARNPSEYVGKHFVFTAMISSAREGGLFTGYQKYYISYAFNESKAKEMINSGWADDMDDAKIYGMDYDTCVWLLDNRDTSSPDYVKILEDDVVKIYGTFNGMQASTNSFTGENGEEVALDIKYAEILYE